MYERVGASQSRRADVRVVATTNRDLRAEVAAGRFRQDLYFRIAVVPIAVPPLRQRATMCRCSFSILPAARRIGSAGIRASLPPTALDLLCHYHWPGNVRELENLVTRASVLASGRQVTAEDLRLWLIDPTGHCPLGDDRGGPPRTGRRDHASACDWKTWSAGSIEATLEHYGGHRAKAAQALGIGIRTLTNKLRQYGYAPRARTFGKVA